MCDETKTLQHQPLTSTTSGHPSTLSAHDTSTREEQQLDTASPEAQKEVEYQQVDIQPLPKSLCKIIQNFESDLTPTFICRSFRSYSMPRGHMFPPEASQNHIEPSLSSPNLVDLVDDVEDIYEHVSFVGTGRTTDSFELLRPFSTPNLSSLEWQDSSIQSSKHSTSTLHQVSTDTVNKISSFPKQPYKLPRTVSVPALNGSNTESMFHSIYHSHISSSAFMHNSLLSVGTQTYTTGTQTSSSPFDEFSSVVSIHRPSSSIGPLPSKISCSEMEEIHQESTNIVATSQDCADVIDEEVDDVAQSSFNPYLGFSKGLSSGEILTHPNQAQSKLNLVTVDEKPKRRDHRCCPSCVVL